jgi:HNH endonuclease
VHHIRPWATGGLTEEQNLICLCHTCHSGLSPHDEPGLFSLIGRGIISRGGYAKEIIDGMFCYCRLVKQDLECEIAMSNAERSENRRRHRRKPPTISTHRPGKQRARVVPNADVKSHRQPGALRSKLRVGVEFFEPLTDEE